MQKRKIKRRGASKKDENGSKIGSDDIMKAVPPRTT
jgi:hypothetical protein